MYWYVLICIGLFEHIYACIGSQIDCKPSNLVPALESTFNAISTVDTAEMSLCLHFQSTLLQHGQRERPWQLPVPD